LSVSETDPELRVRQTAIAPSACARCLNAAVPIRLNLLRLEHELQTVVDGSASRRRLLLWVLTVSAAPLRQQPSPPARAPRGQFRMPCSFKGIGLDFSSASFGASSAPERIESLVRLCPRYRFGSRRGGRAGCPDGTQPEHLTVSHLFLGPRTWNWQAACRIYPPERHFQGSMLTFSAPF